MKHKNSDKRSMFFNASVSLEELSENEMFKVKGGTSDDGEMLEEVIVVGVIPDEEEEEEEEEEEPEEEPENPEEDPGWWEDNDNTPPPDEPECTCEVPNFDSPKNEIQSQGYINDTTGILNSLKNTINSFQSIYAGFISNPSTLPAGFTSARVGQQIDILNGVESMINSIESSHGKFRIVTGTGAGGYISKDQVSGEYLITLAAGGNGFSNEALLLHELVHANQILNGELGFDANGNPTMYGMEDEIAAYQMQYNFEAGLQPLTTITGQFINNTYPNMYNNLPQSAGKCPVHG